MTAFVVVSISLTTIMSLAFLIGRHIERRQRARTIVLRSRETRGP